MKTIIPFKVNYSPIKSLVLIPFEKNPDKIYRGLELQYIDNTNLGTGYRVIAYRNDNYVDVYDDMSLQFQEDEKFNVAENGLNKHIQTPFSNVLFEKQNNCEMISFSFKDLEQRSIEFQIKEVSTKKTIPINLLAPVGYGSKNPNYLPLFFMYDFDFIKSNKTKINCSIDNNKISIDKFPFPMNMQFRYFVRYSNQCELIEFANTDSKDLTEVNIDNNSYMDGNIEYIFEESNSLEKIIVHLENENININFIPSLNMNKNITGCFKILPNPKMGHLDGIYNVTKEAEKTIIKLSITDGWRPVPTSFISKLILNKNSIFCKWSKKYEFIAEINTTKKLVKSKWKNNN